MNSVRFHVLLLSLLVGGCAGVSARKSSPGTCELGGRVIDVRVLSINIRHDRDRWKERIPLLATELARLKPDLVGLQEIEIIVNQGEILLAHTRAYDSSLRYTQYAKLKSGSDAQRGEGIGVWSLAEPIDTDFTDLGFGRPAVRSRVLLQGVPVDIVNVHLDATRNLQIRESQTERLVAWMDSVEGACATFLTGDFNATPKSETIVSVRAAGFRDTYAANPGSARKGATVPVVLDNPKAKFAPTRRIDYIFMRVDPRVRARVLRSRVAFDRPAPDGLYPSDHLGVVSDIRLSKK